MNISIKKVTTPKQRPDYNKLGFGQYFTDHMFLMNYNAEKGWHDARIVPHGDITIDPAAMCLHYGLECFEGMKAYKAKDGSIKLFRPEDNGLRMARSCEGICMEPVPVDMFLEAVNALVDLDRDWTPEGDGMSLYIRPFVIATEGALGVRPAEEFMFIIILSPVASYYPGGLTPIAIKIEESYVRAVKGGTGALKVGGNYAASVMAQTVAKKEGYAQVLFLDGVERTFVEEVGAMNVMFVIDGEVITPDLSGSILPGITRDSVIKLIKSWGIKVSERPLSAEELLKAYEAGTLTEGFGTGTAAVISPIGSLGYNDKKLVLGDGNIGPISQRVYDTLTGIQCGNVEDPFGWVKTV